MGIVVRVCSVCMASHPIVLPIHRFAASLSRRTSTHPRFFVWLFGGSELKCWFVTLNVCQEGVLAQTTQHLQQQQRRERCLAVGIVVRVCSVCMLFDSELNADSWHPMSVRRE